MKAVTRRMKTLRILLNTPGNESYGFEITRAAGLSPGSVYAILVQLETDGWATSRWAVPETRATTLMGRHYFKLTPAGVEGARRLLTEAGL